MWTALDAEFYLAFDAGREDCVDLAVAHGGGTMLLLPTGYQEIADHCVQTQDDELRAHALDAMKFMTTNNVLAAPAPAQNIGMDKVLAKDIKNAGLVPLWDQALILAEAACVPGVGRLLTLDRDIAGIDRTKLDQLINNRDLQRFDIKTV
jgi:hypothetical protein